MNSYSDMPLNELRVKAQLALAGKSAAQNLFFRNAWKRVDAVITSQARRDARSFEVHHAVEVARRKFFEAMCGGASSEDCERLAIVPNGTTRLGGTTNADIRDRERDNITNTGDC